MSNRQTQSNLSQENILHISWHDSQLIAALCPENVMDYFCRKSNPFYDRVCNNETIRMQRLGNEHLHNMVGVEYILLHVAEPILYVIRKQHRHSPTEATPIAEYYVIGGRVYKAPDLASVINSRILSTVTNLQSAFEEASSYARYHPNKGYTWDFATNKALSDKSKAAAKKDNSSRRNDGATQFQKQRTDMLLIEFLRKFPPPIPPIIQQHHIMQQQQLQQMQHQDGASHANENISSGTSQTITMATNNSALNHQSEASPTPTQGGLIEPKIESCDMPPPEKKMKL